MFVDPTATTLSSYIIAIQLQGGGFHGERLNKLYREGVDEEAIVAALTPLFKRYALERQAGEHFGDFCIRVGVIKATTAGKNFHEL